jgi:hypothetical protein
MPMCHSFMAAAYLGYDFLGFQSILGTGVTAIVISYRREDTQGTTGRIFDRLEGHYGQGRVFMDIDNIPFGTDFRHHLQETLDHCDILLVVVGPRWFGQTEDGQARLFEEEDWVRIEVATALAKKIPVIPLLVEGARMPKGAELPEDLQSFAFRQAAIVDVGLDFRVHMERLTKSMDRILAIKKSPEPTATPESLISISNEQAAEIGKLPEPQSERDAVAKGAISKTTNRALLQSGTDGSRADDDSDKAANVASARDSIRPSSNETKLDPVATTWQLTSLALIALFVVLIVIVGVLFFRQLGR